MKAYINTKHQCQDGTYDSYLTVNVPIKETTRPWKGRTVSGYGSALPTEYMVFYNGRWQRVKVICYSNCESAYIGNKFTPCLTVDIERE